MSDPAPTPKPDLGLTPPLGLPVGSVRALVTLAVLGTTWVQLLQGHGTSEVLRDTLLLVLGYYFGTRGAKRPAADAFAAPADREANPKDPLYLPKGSIRLLIILGFIAVGWKLHSAGKLVGPTGPPTVLVLVGTFLAGSIAKGGLGWVGSFLAGRVLSLFGHLLALVTLAVVAAYCLAVAFAQEARLPPWFEAAFLGIVGFYMGKR